MTYSVATYILFSTNKENKISKSRIKKYATLFKKLTLSESDLQSIKLYTQSIPGYGTILNIDMLPSSNVLCDKLYSQEKCLPIYCMSNNNYTTNFTPKEGVILLRAGALLDR